MHFVGKILVVVQLVLSIVFLAFAGVVYSAHMNWRAESDKQTARAVKAEKDLGDTRAEMERQKNEFTGKVNVSNQLATQTQAENQTLRVDVARLTKDNNELQVARRTAVDQSMHAGQESQARVEEANNVRRINEGLTTKRDIEAGMRIKLEDELRSTQLELELAQLKNRQLLAEKSVLQQALEAAGIVADPKQLANRNAPPPAVKGRVVEVKPGRKAGDSELVTVELGSDDGLKKGDEMTVYRPGLENGSRPKYLARIVIVHVAADQSVARVVEDSRNGVIKVGDNATTKL